MGYITQGRSLSSSKNWLTSFICEAESISLEDHGMFRGKAVSGLHKLRNYMRIFQGKFASRVV